MTSIILNSITGLNYPYDVYVCDVYGNNCGYVAQIDTNVPSPVEIVLPIPFNLAPAVGIKIITSDGCEKFIVFDCIYITPTLTPTNTPTPSITPSVTPTLSLTPTNTPTPTPNCIIWNWQAIGANFSSLEYYNCSNTLTIIPVSAVTNSSGSICVNPSSVPTWNPTPSVGTHILGSTGVVCYNPTPTPTITPTNTPTPTYPYVFDPYVYLVPEPQDTTSLSNLATYMYNSGATNFLGWGNGGVPSVSGYSNDLNVYIHYSGFTGSVGNFVTNISTLKGYIKQTSGTSIDTFGCIQDQYTFNTIEVSTSQVNTGIQYFYSLWIPLNAVGGSMTNMTIDIGTNTPCSNDVGYNVIPDSTLSSINVVVSSGAAIPSNVYRVLWIDPTCLIPSSVPPPSLSSSIFFKGNTKT
ncbi:MAG: hypothetical protein EBU66_15515 [Bacteroidetes bacterium]|nr:hypothetical protein [Bacteroidota bacterium]